MSKIFIKTYGCTLNQSDSEVMAGYLKEAGHKLVKSEKDADLVIINTCTVKDPAEKKFFSSIEKYRKMQKSMVVSGCIPQADFDRLKGVSIIGVSQLDKIVHVVQETLEGNIVQLISRKSENQRLCTPKIRKNNLIEIIPLCQGCLGECTYCKTRYARGKLESYPKQAIIEQFKQALGEGIYEFWFTAQDLGAYGKDIGTTFPQLMKEILKIKGDYRIRLGMINPNFVKEYLHELMEIFADTRVFKFLHMPVQSGSDRILGLMKRKYTVSDFKSCIDTIRRMFPMMTIATDVIVGFSGETEEEFQESYDLIKEYQIPVVNVSKYYPRPGTPAFKEKKIPTKIVKERSKSLSELREGIAVAKDWKDWLGEIYVDEVGKKGSFVGRNDWYKPVVVSGKDLLGKKLDVKIVGVEMHYLRGEIIS
ncbi:MAG: tRNA (N(6)-L-threonylcarbamoyladenosine(37)-C(2))-methylthiotransferase [Nanoarchaeota archaeon]|nr:tRNA (N(6)-L-threonylcarbamoyladenosine(37)-C(2))-methylthiotransferase [Nanoarchaeota archaeon]